MSGYPETKTDLDEQEYELIWHHLIVDRSGKHPKTNFERNYAVVQKLLNSLAKNPRAREFASMVVDAIDSAELVGAVHKEWLADLVAKAEEQARQRATSRALKLLAGNWEEWEKLDQGCFWKWCYEGCSHEQRENVAEVIWGRLRFADGSSWEVSKAKGKRDTSDLLKEFFGELISQCVRPSPLSGAVTTVQRHSLLSEAIEKARRWTRFLHLLAERTSRDGGDSLASPSSESAEDMTSSSSESQEDESQDDESQEHESQDEARTTKMPLSEELDSVKPSRMALGPNDGGHSQRASLNEERGLYHILIDRIRAHFHRLRASIGRRIISIYVRKPNPDDFEIRGSRPKSSPSGPGGSPAQAKKPKTRAEAELTETLTRLNYTFDDEPPHQ